MATGYADILAELMGLPVGDAAAAPSPRLPAGTAWSGNVSGGLGGGTAWSGGGGGLGGGSVWNGPTGGGLGGGTTWEGGGGGLGGGSAWGGVTGGLFGDLLGVPTLAGNILGSAASGIGSMLRSGADESILGDRRQKTKDAEEAARDKREKAQRAQAGVTGVGPMAGTINEYAGLAAQRYGAEAGKAMRALLIAEGGMTGGVGDTTGPGAHPTGSHGPLQFHPGGELLRYAEYIGTSDLAVAGKFARDNPGHAVDWALRPENYLGRAMRTGSEMGLTGDEMLRHVVRAQNGGALLPGGAAEMQRYRDAYQQASQQPLVVSAPTGGTLRSPFGEAPYRIAFDVNQRYTVPLPGGTTHHRGVDLVPSSGPALGAPVVALAPGTVVDFRQGGAQGNAVVIQAADGTYHSYFHLLNPNQFRPGTPIQAGQRIGEMGQSGSEGFPHLHLEVRRNLGSGDPRGSVIDPLQYFGLR